MHCQQILCTRSVAAHLSISPAADTKIRTSAVVPAFGLVVRRSRQGRVPVQQLGDTTLKAFLDLRDVVALVIVVGGEGLADAASRRQLRRWARQW